MAVCLFSTRQSALLRGHRKRIYPLRYSDALIYLYTITFDRFDPFNLTNTEKPSHTLLNSAVWLFGQELLPHLSFYTRSCYLLEYFSICWVFFFLQYKTWYSKYFTVAYTTQHACQLWYPNLFYFLSVYIIYKKKNLEILHIAFFLRVFKITFPNLLFNLFFIILCQDIVLSWFLFTVTQCPYL